jgi:MOSC domain-containing protein YiiM
LGRDDLKYGEFGENFTVSGMLEADVCVGDIYRVGEAMVQVTQARIPCFKLAHKMGIPTFVKDFLNANKSGFYLRVLETGEVGAGDGITLEARDPVGMSVAELNYLLHFDTGNVDKIKRALTIAGLSPSWYRSFEKLTL